MIFSGSLMHWVCNAHLGKNAPDLKRMLGEVCAQYNVRIDPDAPAVAVAVLNRLAIESALAKASEEKLVGEPQIRDSVRWHLSSALFGTGDAATPVIMLKPLSPGLDTNLLITTDRGAYYLPLLFKPDDYVARVAFAYPDDGENERRWQ